ncbi:MAG: antitoxin VapB family protein [Nanoarchaeota archaeon]
MARTLMISNDVYDKLKKIKGENSFSEVIQKLLAGKRTDQFDRLKRHFGTFKGDKEFDKVMRDVRKEWKAWSRKYA